MDVNIGGQIQSTLKFILKLLHFYQILHVCTQMPFWLKTQGLDYVRVFLAVMEKFTENTRFCLICNYLTNIIPALQSRCTRFRFGPLDNEQMTFRLEHVVKTEG